MPKRALRLVRPVETWVQLSPETELALDLATAVFARAALEGWSDLRTVQEMVILGVARELAYDIFLAKMHRQAPAICVHCGKRFTSNKRHTRWCQSCRSNGVFQGRQKKQIARAIANVAVKRGKLPKQPCRDCGAPKAEKHHPDYAKPLEVIWLCRDCHMAEHERERNVPRETPDAA